MGNRLLSLPVPVPLNTPHAYPHKHVRLRVTHTHVLSRGRFFLSHPTCPSPGLRCTPAVRDTFPTTEYEQLYCMETKRVNDFRGECPEALRLGLLEGDWPVTIWGPVPRLGHLFYL